MRTPTIHINGTSRAELLEQVTDASDALCRAIDALAKTAPNGRDYYPQGPEAIREAMAEHASRLERLTAVRRELVELAEAIAD